MKARYEVNEDDIRTWIRIAIRERGDVRRSVRLSMVLMPVTATLLGWLTFGGIGAAVGLAAGLIIGLLVVPQLMKRTIESRIDTSIDSLPDGIVGPNTLEVLEDRVVWTTTAVQSTWKRSAIRQVSRTADHAFLMFGPENAIVVPLRHDDSGDLATVVSTLQGAPPPIVPR